jgi:hypothetical protein
LKNLIEKPKKFLKPKLIKIIEENEMIASPKTNMAASGLDKPIEKSSS